MAEPEELEDLELVDCWEDFEQNPEALEMHLKKMSMNDEKLFNKNTETIILSEDGQRTALLPQEPKIMILQRPSLNSNVPILQDVSLQKQKVPLKTLQQREVEYAQARLRILGNSGGAEDSKNKNLVAKLDQSGATVSTNQSSLVEPVTSLENAPSHITIIQKMKPIEILKPNLSSVSIIRSPQGAGSHRGFQQKRNGNSKIS